MYIPSTTHVTPIATVRRERTLPAPGQVSANENSRVNPNDVLAKLSVPARHYIFDLTRRLKVRADQTERYVLVGQGVAVEKGEVLAQRAVALGLRKLAVRAPAKGTVVAVGGGKLLFAADGEALELIAGYQSTVVSVNSDASLTTETTAALVQGVWGSGKQAYSVIRVLSVERDSLLPVDLFDVSTRGAIVIGGFADESVFEAALTWHIHGLILGSMPAALIPLAQKMPFPVMITEGFGQIAMTEVAWKLLRSNDGHEVWLDARPAERWTGHRPEAIMPTPPPNPPPPIPADGRPLAENQRVRVLREPFVGAVGTVKRILPRLQTLPSGVQAPCAHVELESRELALVPLDNLEIFD